MDNFILKKGKSLERLPFNREILPNLKLQQSLKEFSFVDSVKLIKTSLWGGKDKLFIIDGQHRYNEGFRLEMDIPCSVVLESNDIHKIVKLMSIYNNTQRKWTLDNFVDCYCELAISDYIYLKNKKRETGYTYATLVAVYSGLKSTSNLKNGTFKINDVGRGDSILSYTKDILKITKLPMRSILGFIMFFNNIKDYNHLRFIKNLSSNLSMLDNCIETMQYSDKFNDIYKRAR